MHQGCVDGSSWLAGLRSIISSLAVVVFTPPLALQTKKKSVTLLQSNCFRKLEMRQQSTLAFEKVVVVNFGQEVKFIVQ